MLDAITEGEWLVSLDERSKGIFLVNLARELTIAGRISYVPQSEELSHPAWLRQVNEIQHRVLACLSEVMSGTVTDNFQYSIPQLVFKPQDKAFNEYLVYAWVRAKTCIS